jgi:hypothetical protein
MKHLLTVMACLFLLSLTFPPNVAGAPVQGTYKSPDLGGTVTYGRYAISRPCAQPCGGVGDVALMQSWDGTSLGSVWYASCAKAPVAYSLTINGIGSLVYARTFVGGTFHLEPGVWGSGNCTLDTTRITTTIAMSGGNPQSARENISTSGVFEGGVCRLTYFSANGYSTLGGIGGDTGWPQNNVKTALYPAFLGATCAAGPVYGSWGAVNKIDFRIDCTSPTKPATWGTVRNLYR